MSEYIVELPDSGAADEAVKRFGVDDSRLYGYRITDEIVRCSDCRLFDTRKCKSHWPFRFNGYCAWGERR